MPLPVVGTYHVATFPGWESIVEPQCARMHRSGILAQTERVIVGIVGAIEPARSTIRALLGEKARIHLGGPIENYEFGTLQRLHDDAQNQDFHCWYIHTKGASRPSAERTNWRMRMESIVLDDHLFCRKILGEYDACGPFWRLIGFDQPRPHFSGNFWWANSCYLRSLPSPAHLDTKNRYEAEFWIGRNPAIKVFDCPVPSDPFGKPSAWVGCESVYQRLCEIGDQTAVKCIVDIGVDFGYSTFTFAKDFPSAEVFGISEFDLHGDSESWVLAHLNQFPNLRIIRDVSPTVSLGFSKPIDILHIDGDHAFNSVRSDFDSWSQWVRPGGRVLFHDIEAFASVRSFFDALPGRKKEIKEHHGLGCWFKEA